MTKTISIKNLKKHYGKVKAVDGISLDIKKGEIFGFLGPNGAGKTTAIRCMMDFIRPTSGSISILGRDSFSDSVKLKDNIGYIAPDPRLYPNWTGMDHINFVKRVRGGEGDYSRFVSELDFDTEKKVRNLSSGNKQKLSLILAFITDPEILILDEPTSGLDPLLQNTIYQILAQFSKKGKTIFMSSHNLSEVERVCQKVAIIKKGKIVEVESISSLKKKRVYKITLGFEGSYNISDFKLKGVEVIDKFDHQIILTVKDDINPLLKQLAKHNLKDLEIEQAGLEEIFLEFYQ